jgi:hypothetical protein
VTRSAELGEAAWARIEPFMPQAEGGFVRGVIIARWESGWNTNFDNLVLAKAVVS